eukprot:CAMPEP_0178957786 /NCGR_PEP_ID=MMETSP0789-20121207/11146_1 /TAXON_ID=3005 /ORGANISM="Rhizosolenia setigera, Strain CCMP 1694" /LENGTH=304 /DNA_ID=CAMNT_0020640151 /DNA_START=56 /DNA_END=970 /DNA_ORIENTATION=-
MKYAYAFSLILASCLQSTVTASSADSPISTPEVLPSGGASVDYASKYESVKSSILEKAMGEIETMGQSIIDESTCIPTFGVRSDKLCNQALEEFASTAPDAGDDAIAAATYDRKLEELESALDAPLQVLYLRQLSLLREKALQKYRSAARTSEASDYEAMMAADSQFAMEAEDATRDGSDWSFAGERAYLRSVMNDLASSGKKMTDIQLKHAQQTNTAMQYLQQQQQMIQQLQMQLYGQTSPWNVGVAYRIPDTNFNLNGSYQQGKANLQISCVPDEYAPMLGPNGFTNGVGPGNLGLSVNLSI